MKILNRLPQLLRFLALTVGLIGGPAWGQGTTPQTITWQGTPNEILSLNVPYVLAATASSGLPVTLRVDGGPAVIANGTIAVTELGTVWVTAEQAGDATYAAARLTRSFNVRQALLTRVGGFHPSGPVSGMQVVGNYAYLAAGSDGLQVVDVSNPVKPVRVGGLDTSGYPRGVQVVGDYAYLADGGAGLQVIDVSVPASPVLVGGVHTIGFAYDVQVKGNYAYVATAGSGLQVIDVSNSANPVRVGYYDDGNSDFENLQVVGNYAYVANYRAGLQVFDVSSPASPVRVGGYDTSGIAFSVAVSGNYAYVSDGDAGLLVIDVGNPANPVRVGGYGTRGEYFGVQLVGNYAYLTDDKTGLQVIDVSNPTSPVRVGGVDTRDFLADVPVVVVGNYVYVADGRAGLLIFELRLGYYPQTLTWQGTIDEFLTPNVAYPLGATASSGLPVTLRVDSGPAVLANGTITATGFGTVVVNAEQAGDAAYFPAQVTRSFNVRQAQSLILQGIPAGATAPVEVAVTNGFLSLPRITSSGAVVTYSVLSGPARIEGDQLTFTGSGAVRLHAAEAGDLFYLPLNEEWTVHIYLLPQTLTWQGTSNDILPLNTLHALAATSSSGLPVTLRVDRGPAVLANGMITVTAEGMIVVSAEQAGDPTYAAARVTRKFNATSVQFTLLGELFTHGSANSVQVVGQYTYVADGGQYQFLSGHTLGGGLKVFDGGGVQVAGARDNEDSIGAYDVDVVGNYAYVASGGAGLNVIDVRNPANPAWVGGVGTSGAAVAVQVKGLYAFVADGDAGLQVISVGNRTNPVRVGGFDTSGYAVGVHVVDNYAYVADGNAGLQVIDVSDPTNAVRVGGYDTSGSAYRVQVVGNYAYVADGLAGLQVIDVSDPANPVRVGGYGGVNSTDVQVAGNYAYVADGVGLVVIDVTAPANPVGLERVVTDTLEDAHRVYLVGSSAYVAGRPPYSLGLSSGGVVQILELRIGDPQTLTWQGTIDEFLTPNVAYPLGATASSGLPVTLRVDSGPAVLANGTITATGFGTVVVSAEQAGDAAHFPIQVTRSFNVRQAQSLILQGIPAGSAEPVEVAITSGFLSLPRITSRGAVVTYSVLSGPARIEGDQLTFSGFGAVRMRAEAAGDLFYLPLNEEWTVHIYLLPQTLTWHGTPNEILSLNVAYALAATSSSGLPVTLRVDSGPAVLANGIITVNEVGIVMVVAEQAGDATYAPARVTRSFNVRQALVTRVGGYNTSGNAVGVQVVGNYAYVADNNEGLQVIDVSVPANPVRVGGYDTSGIAFGVLVVGNYAYVADYDAGLQIIDVSNPSKPVRVGGYDTSGAAVGVHVVGNYAYVADVDAGLEVIDVSVPARPVRVGGVDTSGNAVGVQVVGNYAYVADGDDGLQVIDVRDPAMLVRVGGYDTSGAAVGVHVVGNYAYVADYYEGLQILEIRLGYPQTLELQLSSEVSFDTSVGLVGVANSGLPLTLSVVSGPATVVNNQLAWTGLGPVTLRAEQAGDASFLPASAEWTVTVTLPRLGVRLEDGQVEVFWATGLAGLQLQGRESLSPDSAWQEVTTPPVESDGEARVPLDESVSPRYLRLLKP